MSTADRTVHRLRLRATEAAQARHAALRLEDALRCASLPDADGRLLLVRRLDLGRIRADASSQTLALLIEARLHATGTSWVHGDAPGAPQAGAVWFRDRGEALTSLALRAAAGQALEAWFWPRLVRGLATSTPRHALAQALQALAALPEAAAALPHALRCLAAAGHAGVAPAAPAAARRARPTPARAQWPRPPVSMASADALRPAGGAPPATLPAPVATPPGTVDRAPAGGPDPAAGPGEASSTPRRDGAAPPVQTPGVAATDAARFAAPLPADVEEPRPASPSNRAADDTLLSKHTADPANAATVAPAQPAAPPARAERPAERDRSPPWSHPHGVPAGFETGQPTQAGGLLFLLPVLGALDFGGWAERAGGAPGVAAQVLALAAQRLRVPPEDPLQGLLAELLADTPPADPASDAHPAVVAWLQDARRWLRRHARIGLASLALRPARLAWTASHLDLHFDLGDADLRVRRAGLDIDPGWLPWLGRVVAFHYERRQ